MARQGFVQESMFWLGLVLGGEGAPLAPKG